MAGTKEQVNLTKLMRDRNFEKERALYILSLACEYDLGKETIIYIKYHISVKENDVLDFLLDY